MLDFYRPSERCSRCGATQVCVFFSRIGGVRANRCAECVTRLLEETDGKSIKDRRQDTKLLADPHQKPAKKADLLIQKSTLLTRLLDIEVEERKDSAIQENETLKKETSAFRELNITPEQVAALREENGSLTTQLEMLSVNARNDAHSIERQQNEIETLKKNLVHAVQSISDPLFGMRAFLALKGETRDECLNGAKVREWLQCEIAYSGKEKMIEYLHDHRAKKSCELQIGYCYARLQAEHGMTSADCESLFTEQDAKQAKEKLERCVEAQIREAREANLRQPKELAGDQEWNPEWRQPVPVRVEQPPISGSATDWSPWVK
jgi:hypothetical protein